MFVQTFSRGRSRSSLRLRAGRRHTQRRVKPSGAHQRGPLRAMRPTAIAVQLEHGHMRHFVTGHLDDQVFILRQKQNFVETHELSLRIAPAQRRAHATAQLDLHFTNARRFPDSSPLAHKRLDLGELWVGSLYRCGGH